MSISFRRFVGAVFLAICIAELLSRYRGVGVVCVWWHSESMRRSQVVYCTAVDAARYSASQVDSATTFCFEDVQLMGERLTVCRTPV